MNSQARIASILNTTLLDESITGIPNFDLSTLELPIIPAFEIPNNLRLGHLVEKIVSALIKASKNYTMLFENLQIKQHKNTIGEIDFIIKNTLTNECIHLELAYKFYLFDSTLSTVGSDCWIGPNRRDSLKEKLNKLHTKQFPLLYRDETKQQFPSIAMEQIKQRLCLLASLYIPYECQHKFDANYQKAIKGYYVNFETYQKLHTPKKSYYLPPKKEWGMSPNQPVSWMNFEEAQKEINRQLQHKHAPLCWEKHGDTYTSFFIVWWS